MRVRYALGVMGILAVLGIAACGSSGKSNSTAASHTTASIASPTSVTAIDPAFRARVDAICARANRRTAAFGQFPYPKFDPQHPDLKTLPGVAAYFSKGQPIIDRVPVEMRQLGEPEKARKPWRELLGLATQARTIADRQIVAAKSSDAGAFVATVNELGANQMKLEKVAIESGFSGASPCTKTF
jgi:hypothetical protein